MATPDYQALLAEVTNDPVGLGYAGKTDDEIAALLNTADRVVSASLLPLSTVGIWAAKTGVRAKIGQHAANDASPVQSVCLTILDLLQGLNGPPLELDNADNAAMIDALVAVGVMTAGDKTGLLALGETRTSRALELPGWGVAVQAPDVAHVRTL